MPPLKGYNEIESLSGGEKAIAALAFLFAFNSYSPSPFFLLDEVDDALDALNVTAAARYIHSRSSGQLYSQLLKSRDISALSIEGSDSLAVSEFSDPTSRPQTAIQLPKEVCFHFFFLHSFLF